MALPACAQRLTTNASTAAQSRRVCNVCRKPVINTSTFRTAALRSNKFCKLGRNSSEIYSLPEQSTSSAAADLESDKVPLGCQRYTLQLKKPLGMILEGRDGKIIVAELVKGGAAEKTGMIQPGDELIATSAVVYTILEDYGGVDVRKGEKEVRLMCRGEAFSAVMAAIGSVPGVRYVTLEFQRCDPV